MRFSCLARAVVRLTYAALILLAAGVIAGGVMLAMLVVVDLVMVLVDAPMQFRGGFLVGIVAFPFWLIGSFAVGPPLWAALHFSRLRGRRTAVTAGALAGGAGLPIILWLMDGGGAPTLSPTTAASVAVLSAIAGISGAVAGEAIHRLAYRSGEIAHAR